MENSDSNAVTRPPVAPKSSKVSISFDLKWVVIFLLLVIVGLVVAWRPWSPKVSSQSRTISVTGDAEIKAAPDEFVFSPSYDFKDADKAAALAALTSKQAEIVAGLKKLGVTDKQIQTDSSGYDQDYSYDDTDKTYDYTLDLTITLDNAALTQKVQDYLVGTSPTGSVSPDAQFSDAKQKQLEAQGRDQATKDARTKADQSAKNLGFTLGAVKTVSDDDGVSYGGGCGQGAACPLASEALGANTDSATKSLSVQAGQSSVSYSVTVVYYVR